MQENNSGCFFSEDSVVVISAMCQQLNVKHTGHVLLCCFILHRVGDIRCCPFRLPV